MPDFGNTSVFSQTDASNNSGTMPSWSGSALPSTIDDAGRAFQGAVTREWNWRNLTLTSAGTANAQTLTYSVAPAALYNGQQFSFIAGATNSSTTTLNINSLGATAVKKLIAGTATALSGGEIVSGYEYTVRYNSANTCFLLETIGARNLFVASEAQGDVLYRNASGWVRLGAGTSGQFLQTQGAAANPQWATATSSFTTTSLVATTSGIANGTTSISGSPKVVHVSFVGVTNSTSGFDVQIGSGSYTTTGYTSTGTNARNGANPTGSTSTAGFYVNSGSAAVYGVMTLTHAGSNIWTCGYSLASGSNTMIGGGAITIAGALDRLQVKNNSGDAFSAGSFSVSYL